MIFNKILSIFLILLQLIYTASSSYATDSMALAESICCTDSDEGCCCASNDSENRNSPSCCMSGSCCGAESNRIPTSNHYVYSQENKIELKKSEEATIQRFFLSYTSLSINQIAYSQIAYFGFYIPELNRDPLAFNCIWRC